MKECKMKGSRIVISEVMMTSSVCVYPGHLRLPV